MSDRPSKFNCHKNCLQKIKVTYIACKIKTHSDSASLFDSNRLQNSENARKMEMIIIYYWCTSLLVHPPSQIKTRMSALKILQFNRNLIYLWFVLPRTNAYIKKLSYANIKHVKKRLESIYTRELCSLNYIYYASLLASGLYIWRCLWINRIIR